MKLLIASALLIALTACANPYEAHYVSSYGQIPAYPSSIIPHSGDPQLINVRPGGLLPQSKIMLQEGFVWLGSSSFTATSVSERKLYSHAKAVKAHTVLHTAEYAGSSATSIPITSPYTKTTSHSGTFYSRGSQGTYSGSSTSYGTKTTYIPVTFHMYDYRAWYWVKRREGGLGVHHESASYELGGEDQGALVTAVVRGSSADKAGILEGDVITKVGADDILDSIDFRDAERKYTGGNVTIEFDRGGSKITKEVSIEAYK